MEFLRAEYTEVWTPSAIVPLVRFADRVRSIATTGLDLLGLPDLAPPAALVDRLRSFDTIFSWYGTNRPDFREMARTLGLPFEFLEALPPADSRLHAADFFLRQVGGVGAALPRVPVPPMPREDFAVIQPFSGSPRKNWPLEHYRELAAKLNIPVQWCAGPDEALDGAIRFTDLYELACWLARGQIYIGNDSGITHLAAAVGTPTVAIFGPTDPALWAPRGEQVRIVSGDLTTIAPVEVLRAVKSLNAA